MDLKLLSRFSFILLLILYTKYALEITAIKTDGHDNIRCTIGERRALLKFKESLHGNYTRRLDSWGSKGHDDDCCKWRGVECSNTSGQVIGLDLSHSYVGCLIDPSLQELQHLIYLNLSGNTHNLCEIPSFIGKFTKLMQLDLSYSDFGGRIPHELGNLSMLEFLDLSQNEFNDSGIPESLGFLKNLIHLDISYYFPTMALEIPYQLKNLSRLQYLDLGHGFIYANNLEWVSHLHRLRYLGLEGTNLSKAIDWVQTIMNLPQLIRLQLSNCDLPNVAPLDSNPKNASSSLSFIDLYGNKLTSKIFQWIFNFSSSLSEIHLAHTHLSGPILDDFGNMPSLIYLDLSSNKLKGDIPNSFGRTSASLRYLMLHDNILEGNLSNSIGRLYKLRYLDLSFNSFYGIISENHLDNFSSLNQLFLDSNSLTLRINPQWIPPFQLFTISLSSCNIGPQFPSWLKTQTSFYNLDISSNHISESIPDWLWNLSHKASYLNISNNEIHGVIPSKLFFQNPSKNVDLSSNHFEGQIPLFNHQMEHIILSKNNFSGSLTPLCHFKGEHLTTLDLSENSLSGELPNCWNKKGFQNLECINLSYNKLAGRIPNSICSSPDWSLYVLQLRNNSFSGELPSSLSNCSQLTVLDVSNNMISGSIPEWIEGQRFLFLKVLNLCSNRFSGRLPSNLCWLWDILIIDISHNNISGRVPDCLGSLYGLRNDGNVVTVNDFYLINVAAAINDTDVFEPSYRFHMVTYSDKFGWKGTEYEFNFFNLYVKTMDFSSNNLEGEIPEELGSLIALVQLNFSNNNLSGRIPSRIGEMRMLEVLDLSSNHLSGEIPQSISNLSFLNSLDLSNNNLSGQIPTGTQITTQSAASFMGNPRLCGDPLPKKCHQEEAPPASLGFGSHEEEKDGFISNGFYISMGVGFVIGFWGMLGPLFFHNFWSSAYFRFLNNTADWIYLRYALTIARIQRRLAR